MSALSSELRLMADGQGYNQRARMIEAANELERLERQTEARLEEITRLGDKVREVEAQRTTAREERSAAFAYAERTRAALQALVWYLADTDDEGLIEHAPLMVEARAALAAAPIPTAPACDSGEGKQLSPIELFAIDMLEQHRNGGYPGDVDGGWMQDKAIEAGLLRYIDVSEPCGDVCPCAETDDFPQQCLVYSPDMFKLAAIARRERSPSGEGIQK